MSSQCAAPGLRVHPDLGGMGQRGGYDVDSAVQVQVAKGAAAMPRHGRDVQARLFAEGLPLPAGAQVRKHGVVAPRPVRAGKRAHVAAGDKQVFQPSLSKSNKPGPNPALFMVSARIPLSAVTSRKTPCRCSGNNGKSGY